MARGVAMTTTQCLLSPDAKSRRRRGELERRSSRCLGIHEVDLARRRARRRSHRRSHRYDHAVRQREHDRDLECATTRSDPEPCDAGGKSRAPAIDRSAVTAFRIVELPIPTGRVEFEGERLPLTYANFYIVNGGVVVPVYGKAEDARRSTSCVRSFRIATSCPYRRGR